MLVFGKSPKEMTEADLNAMVGNVFEDEQIEFKSDGYATMGHGTLSEPEKSELRKDVVALANAKGGLIFCGMHREKQGKPVSELRGLGNIDYDKYLQTVTQVLTTPNLIEPSFWQFEITTISLKDSNKGKIVIIKVALGINAPHWVRKPGEKYGKFYVRHGNVSEEMNYEEVREKFLLSQTRIDRIREFRQVRLSQLRENYSTEIPVALQEIRLVAHCIPLNFGDVGGFSKIAIDESPLYRNLTPGVPSAPVSYNFNGKFQGFGIVSSESMTYLGYVQLFRTGAIEYVLCLPPDKHINQADISLDLHTIESEFLKSFALIFNIARENNLDLPFIMSGCLLRTQSVRQLCFNYQDKYKGSVDHCGNFKRDSIILPEFLVESPNPDLKPFFKTSFDIIWNCAGMRKSESYDDQGNWVNKSYS